MTVTAAFRLPPGTAPELAAAARATPTGPADKREGSDALREVARRLDGLHRALWAQSVGGGIDAPRVLLVLQGMDTAGKGGAVRHVARLLDPQGVRVSTFGKPTQEELSHDFLWRIRRALPGPGRIGLFDRSHYEDVLVARVESLVPEAVWRARYDAINSFENELADQGVSVLKCFLAISPKEQRRRLLARLDDPTTQWKFSPDDVAARSRWSDYERAYSEAMTECASQAAPWHVVPANRKWYRNWVVASLLAEALERIDPQFPAPSYDVGAARKALLEADPLS